MCLKMVRVWCQLLVRHWIPLELLMLMQACPCWKAEDGAAAGHMAETTSRTFSWCATMGENRKLCNLKLVAFLRLPPSQRNKYLYVRRASLVDSVEFVKATEADRTCIACAQVDLLQWMPVQAVNFYLLPTHMRVLYVGCTSIIWNGFLSFYHFYNAKRIEKRA